MKLTKNILILSLFCTNFLYGNNIPNIGSVLQEVKKSQGVEERKSGDIPQVGGIDLIQEELPDDVGQKILIKGFKFEGNYSVDTEILQEILASYEGKNLTFSQVKYAVSMITKYYRNQGFFVARAYIPKDQDFKGNIIKVNVIEGLYGNFNLENNSGVKDFIVQGYLDNTKTSRSSRSASVEKNSIERTLLLLNDLPGVVITKAEVKPGNKPLTSDFDIVASKGSSYDGYFIGDNYGGKYTGKERLMAGTTINSPLSLGDQLSLNGMITNASDIISGSASYSLPIYYSGLIGSFGYDQTEYELSGKYSSLDAKGTSRSFYGKLSYPIIRSRLENLYISTRIDSSDLEDKYDAFDETENKRLDKINIGLDYDNGGVLLSRDFYTNFSIIVTYGHLDIKEADKKEINEQGANTQGDFSKINLENSNLIYLTDLLSLKTSISYQHTLQDKNLDGSEDLSIGGAYGVKLYPDGELSAENGYLANVELAYQLPYIYDVGNKIGIFYDIGRVYMTNNADKVGFKSRTLQDVGISYYIDYKNFFLNFYAAYKIDNENIESEPDYNARYMVSTGWTF